MRQSASGRGPLRLPVDDPLLGNQQAALARLLYAVRQPGGLAVLCGPGGSGVTTVLERLAADLETADRRVIRLGGNNVGVMDHCLAPAAAGPAADTNQLPVVLVDDGHLAADGELTRYLRQLAPALPAATVVLAGRGRLLTLLAREQQLSEWVRLRAVLRPWRARETAAVVASHLAAAGVAGYDPAVPEIIHEIAAGIPGAVFRQLETVLLVAATQPDHRLTRADVEQMHERLSLNAA